MKDRRLGGLDLGGLLEGRMDQIEQILERIADRTQTTADVDALREAMRALQAAWATAIWGP